MTTTRSSLLSIGIIGGGPIGLVAAAHLKARGLDPLVFEAGSSVGWSVRKWGHVRMFSPWRELLDDVAVSLLDASGWRPPNPDEVPSGKQLVTEFLEPLGEVLREHIVLETRVTDVARLSMDLVQTDGREGSPFEFRLRDSEGTHSHPARAVLDCSGTYETPNPLGTGGLPAQGEREAARYLHFGVPNLDGRDRQAFSRRRIAVVGSGHTAFHAVLETVRLQRESPDTTVTWIVRGDLERAIGGPDAANALAERERLRLAARSAVLEERVDSIERFGVRAVEILGDGVRLRSTDGRSSGPFDRIVVATGYRPYLRMTRELRIRLDPPFETPQSLAALIDPRLHTCESVRKHGAAELTHPEDGYFILGMKSYGRASTFLLKTGYEQVRSVCAHLARVLGGTETKDEFPVRSA